MKLRVAFSLFILTASVTVMAQSPVPKAPASKSYAPPKLPWGDPDLQGLWPATANIPMQRPANMGDRAVLTDEEVAQRQAAAARQAAADSEQVAKSDTVTINPPGYWVERGAVNRQASLVVDPPNGRIPALTAKAQQAVKDLRGGKGPGDHFPKVVDSWDDFDIYSRCITRGVVSSMLPTLYNFGNEIVQGPGYVAIRNEMIHETRVIPINGKSSHPSSSIRMYMGDSRGHWEGNTLVIETTNLKDQPGVGGALFTDQAKLVERITRTSPEDLSYDLTVSDPNVWTTPWSLHMPYKMDNSYPVYEYACHEGNYMMLDSLMGARELEKKGLSTRVDRGAAGGPPPARQ